MYGKKLFIIGFAALCAITVLILACIGDIQPPEQGGKARVSIIVTGQARTVFPNASLADIEKYKLLGGNNGAEETELAELAAGGATVSLSPGNWNFTLNAYTMSGDLILQGSVRDRAIVASETNMVSFYLSPLNSGTGAVQITIQFPDTAGINRITANSGTEPEEFAVANGSGEFVYAKTGIAAGDYFISFRLYRGDELRTVVSETVLVRGNLTSSKVITLAGEDLKPEREETNIDIPEGGAIIRISTQAGLESIRDHIDDPQYNYGKNAYVLDNDLTLSGTWVPIGTDGTHAFSGNLYGNGHTIRNLVLPGLLTRDIGLFGYIDGALIQDLQVELGETTISITSSYEKCIGIIAGTSNNSVIKNCGVYSPSGITVNATGVYWLGVYGITVKSVEGVFSNIIENCYVSMNITVTNNGGTHIVAGGIASSNNKISNCYYIGTITGTGMYAELHGISDDDSGGIIEKSYSAGTIINNAANPSWSSASGVGRKGTINNSATLMECIDVASGSCYARIQYDHHSSTPTLNNNYAYSGMLLNGTAVTSSNANSQHGLDKTAAELKQRSTYENGLGWDFDDVWEMGPASYPFPILKWQKGVVKLPQGFSVIGGRSVVPLSASNPSEFSSAFSTVQGGPEEVNFTITVTSDLSLAPQNLSLAAYKNKTITLKGNAANRAVSLSGQGSLFTVGEGVELVVEGIALRGLSNNNAPLVKVNKNGKLVLNSGGKVTGNTYNTSVLGSGGAGIYMDGGTLEIIGGEISGNTLNGSNDIRGGGVYVINNGSAVLMTGGAIRNNLITTVHSGDGGGSGGGIALYNNSSFEMTGGIIEGNSVNTRSTNMSTGPNGGGVRIDNSIFYLKGGIIRNNTCQGQSANSYGGAGGGGVLVQTGMFVMSGGIINGNSLTHSVKPNKSYGPGGMYGDGAYGGGVNINDTPNSFIKTGGIIYGNEVAGNDADGIPLKNTAQSDASGLGGGHAVFYNNQLGMAQKLRRNTTAYETNDMDTSKTGAAGGWE